MVLQSARFGSHAVVLKWGKAPASASDLQYADYACLRRLEFMERLVRCLLAWTNEQEAIPTLIGHIPGQGEQIEAQRNLWQTARNAKDARERYEMATPTLAPLPPELSQRSDFFTQRPDVIAAFQGLDWSVGLADLNQVLSFQKIVVKEQALERVDAEVKAHDLQSVFSFCLPDPSESVNLPGAIDHDQKGITFSSLNPNLRIGGHAIVDLDVVAAPGQPSSKQKFIGFTINFGARFVQVAEYNHRWFVRDGYHRCYGLLRKGISRIPCVFVRAHSFEELGAAAPGFFSFETLFGDRPPFLSDFLDDSVSADTKQLAQRKVVRIAGQEFLVAV